MRLNQEQFEKEKNYYVSIYLADKMLKNQLISKKEYLKICKLMNQKYHPILGDILP